MGNKIKNNIKPSGRSGYARTTNMKNKKCSKCWAIRPLNQFYNSKNTKDGKSACCKVCHDTDYRDYEIKEKSVIRKCIGVICRGFKLFKSFGGARLCVHCKNAIKNTNDYYQDQIVVTGRSRRNS